MVQQDLLFQTWFALSVLSGVELRTRTGIIEKTGDPSWDIITSYLEYEEPEYNQKKGFTADDFTDHLVGYQTQATHARSFGWETSAHGEIPYAALLVNHGKTGFCMGTVVTTKAVVTPCACVRTMCFRDAHKSDFDILGDKANDKYLYYEHDIGNHVDVVANHIEYVADHVGRGFYPHVTKCIPDQCLQVWNTDIQVDGSFGFDSTKIYGQLFYLAILELSNNLEFEAPCSWPPFQLDYKNVSEFSYPGDRESSYHYYFNPEADGGPESGIISSFRFIPLEDHDLTLDNDARGVIKTEDRLVNVHAELCSQLLCNGSEIFQEMNNLWYFSRKLDHMLCWCDEPWLGDEKIFPNLRNDESPVYFKSVYGGLIGAPVIHHGDWVAWTVMQVTRNVSKSTLRPTWSRGLDDETINFLQSAIPELKNGDRPKVNDVNRLHFAIHNFKDFVPDADLRREDLNLEAWAQVGNARIVRPKKGRRGPYSAAAAILPSHVLSLFVFTFEISKN